MAWYVVMVYHAIVFFSHISLYYLLLYINTNKYNREMKVKIKEQEIELKNSFRALMWFENLSKKNPLINGGTYSSLIWYFYCVINTSSNGPLIEQDDFMDWLDNDKQQLEKFLAWITEQNKIQNGARPLSAETGGEKKTANKKKKVTKE